MSFFLLKLEVYLSRTSQKKNYTTPGVCYAYTISQNPSMVEVGSDIWGTSCPIPLLRHSHLEQAALDTSWCFGTYGACVGCTRVCAIYTYHTVFVRKLQFRNYGSAFPRKPIRGFLGKKTLKTLLLYSF